MGCTKSENGNATQPGVGSASKKMKLFRYLFLPQKSARVCQKNSFYKPVKAFLNFYGRNSSVYMLYASV